MHLPPFGASPGPTTKPATTWARGGSATGEAPLNNYILWLGECSTQNVGVVKEKPIHQPSTVRPPSVPTNRAPALAGSRKVPWYPHHAKLEAGSRACRSHGQGWQCW